MVIKKLQKSVLTQKRQFLSFRSLALCVKSIPNPLEAAQLAKNLNSDY